MKGLRFGTGLFLFFNLLYFDGMDLTDFISKLDANTQEVIDCANNHGNKGDSNEGAWTALETLEHVFITEKVVLKMMRMPGEQAEQEELFGEGKLNHLLAKREHKVESPDFLKPNGRFSSVEEWTSAFAEMRDQLKKDLGAGVLQLGKEQLPHPYLGQMTKNDWMYFLIAHANRHVVQVKELT